MLLFVEMSELERDSPCAGETRRNKVGRQNAARCASTARAIAVISRRHLRFVATHGHCFQEVNH